MLQMHLMAIPPTDCRELCVTQATCWVVTILAMSGIIAAAHGDISSPVVGCCSLHLTCLVTTALVILSSLFSTMLHGQQEST